jgi:division protein CdvB (Snf7/Vps24/ESCRT-III family)
MLGEWVGLGSLIAVNAGINIGIYKYFNNRLDRVYSRLDEVRDKIDTQFVRKDVCSVMHTQTAQSLTGLEARITERFNKLEKEVSDHFKQLIELLKR